MKETIAAIGAILLVIVIVCGAIFGISKLASYSNSENKRWKTERKEEYKECLDKANDLDWCYNKFINN